MMRGAHSIVEGMRRLSLVATLVLVTTTLSHAQISGGNLTGTVRDEQGGVLTDVEVSLTGNRITISGQRREEKRTENERYYAFERSYGNFSRSFTLPEGVNQEDVQAELRDGVLTVTVAKKPEVQPKRISLTRGEGEGEQSQE